MIIGTGASTISIGAWNICGIKSKLEDPDFLEELLPHDIIILGETFAENENIHVPGYKCKNVFRKWKHKKARKNSGGVSVLTKCSISNFVIPVKTTAEHLIWIKISKKLTGYPLDTYCCCAYIPPIRSPYYVTHPNLDIFEELSFDITKFKKLGHVMVSGDLNARLGAKSDIFVNPDLNEHSNNMTPDPGTLNASPRCSMDKTSNVWGESLIDLCVSHSICVLNGRVLGDLEGKFTFFGGGGCSTIDLCVADAHILANTIGFKVHKFLPYFSSHCKIETILKCSNVVLSEPSDESTTQNLSFDKYVWNCNTSEDKLQTAMSSPEFSALKDKILNKNYSPDSNGTNMFCEDVSNLSKFLHVHSCDKVRVGIKKRKRVKRQKWFTPDLLSLRKRVRRAANYFNRNPFNTQARESVFSLNKQYRKLLKKTKKLHQTANINKLIMSVDSSEMWSILSEIRGKKTVAPIPMKDLYTHFNELLNNPPRNVSERKIKVLESKVKEFLNSKSSNGAPNKDFLPVGGYTPESTKKIIKSLKNGKSAFLDGAINEVLKHSIREMSPVFSKFFNHIEVSATFPSVWKSNFLVPLHKKGSQGDPDNYRGLAVGNNIGKLYTRCLNHKLKTFVEEKGILSPHQFGFRNDYRTSDAIFSLQAMTSYYKNHGNKPIFACFVDFSKAFDSVNRSALMYKLGQIGIRGPMLELFSDMYSSASYMIKSGGKFSIPLSSQVGVKQGCNLSPLLFNIFINDIHNLFSTDCQPLSINDWKVSSLSFADDLVLLSESATGLKNCLSKLESYCIEWGLKVNPLKTKVVVFNKNFTKNIKKLFFTIDGNPIEVTNSYCYLGVEVSNVGSFIKATETLYKKALKSLFSIYSSLDVRSDEKNTRLFLKLFDSLVKPICTYGAEIWGPIASNPKNYIDKFVNKFYRTLLGVPRNTSTAGIHAELGRFPIVVYIQQAMIKYWFRIISLPSDRLTSHCYWSLYNLQPQNDPWLNSIKNIINSSGMHFVWSSQNILHQDPKYLLRLGRSICRTLEDVSLQNTSEKIYFETKLSLFRNCKQLNKLSNFLNIIKGREKRSALSRIRLGTLDLELENGRKNKIPRLDRHCKICIARKVENEEHFILDCPALSSVRDPFIQKINSICSYFTSISPIMKIKFLYFNESLPANILETAVDMLAALLEKRRVCINSINNQKL